MLSILWIWVFGFHNKHPRRLMLELYTNSRKQSWRKTVRAHWLETGFQCSTWIWWYRLGKCQSRSVHLHLPTSFRGFSGCNILRWTMSILFCTRYNLFRCTWRIQLNMGSKCSCEGRIWFCMFYKLRLRTSRSLRPFSGIDCIYSGKILRHKMCKLVPDPWKESESDSSILSTCILQH